jgi:BCD family chlorophyll transporter-like MFS transporter
MEMTQTEHAGMVLGAWGSVQATASGIAMALGGVARDVVGGLATQGRLGEVLVSDVTGYNFVFQTEMVMMFVVLIALGPLVSRRPTLAPKSRGLGLAELPG